MRNVKVGGGIPGIYVFSGEEKLLGRGLCGLMWLGMSHPKCAHETRFCPARCRPVSLGWDKYRKLMDWMGEWDGGGVLYLLCTLCVCVCLWVLRQ